MKSMPNTTIPAATFNFVLVVMGLSPAWFSTLGVLAAVTKANTR